jgi:hypothetical protein
MRLSARDAAAGAVVVVLCAGLTFLYLQERGRTTVRANEKALGTVVFRKLSATRRASGGLVWERIRNNSPVYEADTLRTADSSEASVCFDDGTSLDMFENSMLRLQFSRKYRMLEFLGGDIAIHGPAAGQSSDLSGLSAGKAAARAYTISAGGKTLAVSGGSEASLTRTGDTLTVGVSQGQVGMTHQDGTSETIDRSKELQIDLAAGTSRVVARTIIPVSPQQNARFLVQRAGGAEVEFSWEGAGGTSAVVELSEGKDFDSPVTSAATTGTSARLTVAPGSWYWRVREPEGGTTSARRFTLYAEPVPQPILPAAGAEVSFRKSLPEVPFSWTAMPDAAAYLFEIASEPGFAKSVRRVRTNMESITVNSLSEGTWYWRVSPVHALRVLGEKAQPEVRSLVISKRATMAALAPTSPEPDSPFLVQEAASKGIAFSWDPNPEAVEYELSVSKSRNMDDAAIRRASSQAWLSFSGSEAAAFERPATWYWSVRWKDDEGNLSRYSEPRMLRGVDGALAVRLSFPPEGYTIADSLIGSTRFAWKCNVPAKAVFQLSQDASFTAVTWEAPSEAGTLIGGQWKTGTWYWRIRTLKADGSVFHDTEPRVFHIVDPLPAPAVPALPAGGTFYLRKEDTYSFTWDKVAGADYYQFKLSSRAESGAEILRRAATLEDTKLELPMGQYPPGHYRLLLQAFGLDKPSSTRLIGYLGRTEFTFTILSRMALSAPSDRMQVEGLDARRHGVRLSWSVPDRPETSELLVSGDPGFRSIALRAPAAAGAFLAERLNAGDYYWTVKGKLYGFDLSALETRRFTVRPIPPLRAPVRLAPVRGYRFGPSELRGLSSLRFDWDAVQDATRYAFALYRGADQVPLVQSDFLAEHSSVLNDLSILENGEYRWTVKAQAYDAKQELEQDGIIAESRFRIELPALLPPALKGKETFYGR